MEIIKEEYIQKMIKRIANETKAAELKSELNQYLFEKYCEKGYLSECEPEYCSFRFTHTCRYIEAIQAIQEEFGIKVFEIDNDQTGN